MSVDQAAVDAAIRQQVGLPAGMPSSAPMRPVAAPAAATPPPTPAIDPGLLRDFQGRLDGLNTELTRRDQMLEAMQQELINLRTEKIEAAQRLPSDEELDNMPRTEAIRRVAGVLADKEIGKLRNELVGAMGRMAVDVVQARNTLEEQELQRRFPGLDVEKYRPAIDRKRVELPGASLSELVRLVADPNDLVSQPPDTTPRSHEAVHMESGGGSARGGARSREPSTQITEDQLRNGFLAARTAGNKLQADAYLMEIIKRRPDVPAQHGSR